VKYREQKNKKFTDKILEFENKCEVRVDRYKVLVRKLENEIEE
jgi:hypothetical protein